MLSLGKVKKLVKEKYKQTNNYNRYIHIAGVVSMAKKLASKYKVDKKKAAIAAYMHDYYKYESLEEFKELVKKEDLIECAKYPCLYHAYASAEAYLKLVGNDEDIYNAIRNHVVGRTNMSKLEEIIYISDYTEKNRTYKSCIECRKLIKKGLFYKAIYESTLFTIEHLKNNNLNPHPMQLEVLKNYKGKCEI